MDAQRVKHFLKRYMLLQEEHEGVVVDFVRQAGLGEAPRLVICGGRSTGKTRLRMCLEALVPEVVTLEGETIGSVSLAKLGEDYGPMKPMVVVANSWEQARTVKGKLTIVALPQVWIQMLIESQVEIGAIWEEIWRDGRRAMKEGRSQIQ